MTGPHMAGELGEVDGQTAIAGAVVVVGPEAGDGIVERAQSGIAARLEVAGSAVTMPGIGDAGGKPAVRAAGVDSISVWLEGRPHGGAAGSAGLAGAEAWAAVGRARQ